MWSTLPRALSHFLLFAYFSLRKTKEWISHQMENFCDEARISELSKMTWKILLNIWGTCSYCPSGEMWFRKNKEPASAFLISIFRSHLASIVLTKHHASRACNLAASTCSKREAARKRTAQLLGTEKCKKEEISSTFEWIELWLLLFSWKYLIIKQCWSAFYLEATVFERMGRWRGVRKMERRTQCHEDFYLC